MNHNAKLLIFSMTAILTYAFLSRRGAAADSDGGAMHEFLEGRNEPEIYLAVPEIIRKDMYRAACEFIEKVYPQIDKEWIRKGIGARLLKDRFGLIRVHNSWPPMVCVRIDGTIEMVMAFPDYHTIELRANRRPPGVTGEELKQPLTLNGAETRGREVLRRLVTPNQAPRFILFDSAEAQFDYDYVSLVQFSDSSRHVGLASADFHVRRPDGFIARCNWTEERVRPLVPYEKAVDLAKEIPNRPGLMRTICLIRRYRGCVGTLVWIYYAPNSRGAGLKDETWWDAMTGKLVFSEVLGGGTPQKPYENPKYFPKLDDDVIKRNIERLIKDRMAELEKRKAEEHGPQKGPPGE
jgi:hypothetical protein